MPPAPPPPRTPYPLNDRLQRQREDEVLARLQVEPSIRSVLKRVNDASNGRGYYTHVYPSGEVDGQVLWDASMPDNIGPEDDEAVQDFQLDDLDATLLAAGDELGPWSAAAPSIYRNTFWAFKFTFLATIPGDDTDETGDNPKVYVSEYGGEVTSTGGGAGDKTVDFETATSWHHANYAAAMQTALKVCGAMLAKHPSFRLAGFELDVFYSPDGVRPESMRRES